MIITIDGDRFMVQPECFYREAQETDGLPPGSWVAVFWWSEGAPPARP